MAGAGADAELLVRTMDQVARHAQGQLVRPQRIVRARRHHGRQRIAIGGVLGADRGRRIPGRVLGLGGDAGVRDRRTPALAADAQRIGVHHVLPFRVVVQAVLGQVDHHAFARARRQHEAGRDDHLECRRPATRDRRRGWRRPFRCSPGCTRSPRSANVSSYLALITWTWLTTSSPGGGSCSSRADASSAESSAAKDSETTGTRDNIPENPWRVR